MKKLGLVGGISWISTIDYYKYINKGINERLGGLHFAECVIYSLDFGSLQEQGWNNAYTLLLNACIELEKCKVEGIMLCANTAHLYAEKIQEEISVPIIHIVTATAMVVKSQDIKKVGLLATKFTMESDFFIQGLLAAGIETIIPTSSQERDEIQHTLKEELGRGIVRVETKNLYSHIVNELINRGAEGIIIGCTEIPLLINQEDIDVPLFDTTKIHSQAGIDFALS